MTERETQLETVDAELLNIDVQFQKLTKQKIDLLEKKISELDKILKERNAAIEELSALRAVVRDGRQAQTTEPHNDERSNVVHGEFVSMSVWEAAESVLRRERRELTTREVVDRLEAGGKKLNGKNPASQVHTSISHKTDVFYSGKRKGRSLWGLAEWRKETEESERA
jgi:hypothetical protein